MTDPYLAQAEDGSATWYPRADFPSADEALEQHGLEVLDGWHHEVGDGVSRCELYRVAVRLVHLREDPDDRGWWWVCESDQPGSVLCWEVS